MNRTEQSITCSHPYSGQMPRITEKVWLVPTACMNAEYIYRMSQEETTFDTDYSLQSQDGWRAEIGYRRRSEQNSENYRPKR